MNNDDYFFSSFTKFTDEQERQQRELTYNIPTQQNMNTNQFINDDDFEMHKAIEASLKTNDQVTYEPFDLEQKQRKSGEAVGLKNIGNTCYFNSLLQILYRIPSFASVIFGYDKSKFDPKLVENMDEHMKKRITKSSEMIINLQHLFGLLLGSDEKYVDPSQVLNKCVDDLGNQLQIGDQKDIIEFSISFIERIQEVYNIINNSKAVECINEDLTLQNNKSMMEDEANPGTQSEARLNKTMLRQSTRGGIQSPTKRSITHYDQNWELSGFFGKTTQQLVHPSSGKVITLKDEEEFGPILLDLNHEDLYSCWEESMCSTVEEFRLDDGEMLENSNKIDWIKKHQI